MTKRLHQPTGQIPGPEPDPNFGCVEGADIGELLVAELEARRERLRKLLQLVRNEVQRRDIRGAAPRPHARCANRSFSHTA